MTIEISEQILLIWYKCIFFLHQPTFPYCRIQASLKLFHIFLFSAFWSKHCWQTAIYCQPISLVVVLSAFYFLLSPLYNLLCWVIVFFVQCMLSSSISAMLLYILCNLFCFSLIHLLLFWSLKIIPNIIVTLNYVTHYPVKVIVSTL